MSFHVRVTIVLSLLLLLSLVVKGMINGELKVTINHKKGAKSATEEQEGWVGGGGRHGLKEEDHTPVADPDILKRG